MTRSEYNKVVKKINSQYYFYYGKKVGFIGASDLKANYWFENNGFDNYVIICKMPLEE